MCKKKLTGTDLGIIDRLPPIPPKKVIEDKKHKSQNRQKSKQAARKQYEEEL